MKISLMAKSSSGSSDDFYDAAEELASAESENEDEAPIWATFSESRISNTILAVIPPPPVRNHVPLLPAPPGGNGQSRQARISRITNSWSTNEIHERKISSNGCATPSQGQKIAFHSIGAGTTDDTPQRRRRKLDELRNQLLSFETEKESRSTNQKDLFHRKYSPHSETSSISDFSSLASWNKNVPNRIEDQERTVIVQDSSCEILENEDGKNQSVTDKCRLIAENCERLEKSRLVENCEKLEKSRLAENCEKLEKPRLATIPTKSATVRLGSTSSISGVEKLTADTELRQIPISSSSSSANSSKGNTLDKSNDVASSIVSHRRPSSSRSNKSNSLPKELTGISTCEHYMYSDEIDEATLARKNSEAAELIEALTSELVQKTEREQMQKSSPLKNMDDEETQVQRGPSEVKEENAASTNRSDDQSNRSIGIASTSPKEPDIVSSNRVKSTGSGVDSSDEQTSVVPAKPPRAKRSVDAKMNIPSVSIVDRSTSGADSCRTIDDGTSHDSDTGTEKAASTCVMVKNLDTGEKLPLIALDDISQCINPLTRHIMQLTEADANADSDDADTDSESMVSSEGVGTMRNTSLKENYLLAKQTTLRYKKVLGKKVGRAMHTTISKMKKMKDEVSQHWRKEESSQSDEEDNSESNKVIRVRAWHRHKGPYHFDQIKLAQDLTGEHTGSVWCMKFSHCGRVMATAGQDKDIRVWVLKESFDYFNHMRQKYSAADSEQFNNVFMSPVSEKSTRDTLSYSSSMYADHKSNDDISNVYSNVDSTGKAYSNVDSSGKAYSNVDSSGKAYSNVDSSGNGDSISLCSAVTSASTSTCAQHDDTLAPFAPKPFCVFKGHSADVLDLCWSKNYFLLSSSMDRTVRLWHISRRECLCCFQHAEFVSAIAFLPKDDRYFLSVSLDGKLRVWHIPEKKVALWNEVEGGKLTTALTFARNGNFVVVGTTDGRCVFYTTERLKYHTQIDVKSSHGKNARGHKVTGLDSFRDKLLVTSSDSRIRLYDTRDLSLTCKYKGYYNYGSQIRASFGHDGKYIVCGSEDKNVYLWKTVVDTDMLSLPVRKDRNRRWESIRAHNAVVTAAIFAPRPDLIYKQIEERKHRLSTDQGITNDVQLCRNVRSTTETAGEVLVTADFGGTIYVFFNKPKVRLGSSVFLPSY